MLRLVATVLLTARSQALVVRAPAVRPRATSARMSIAVFGATGGTGGEAVRCSTRARRARCCCRRP